MREFFWRRRNARLTARLNAVVETSERVRKSYRPKAPRVVIDTSFIEAPPKPLDDADADAALPYDGAEFADHVELMSDPAGDDDGAAPFDRLDGEASEAWHAYDAARGGDDTDLLREAVEQLDLADRREAEARQRELAAREEVEALRAQVDALKDAVWLEQKNRSELERELTGLRRASRQGASAAEADGNDRRREAELLQKLSGQQGQVARLEALVAQEKAARVAAERRLADSKGQAEAVQGRAHELTDLRQRTQEACRREADAEHRAEDLRQELARAHAALADEAHARKESEAECRRLETEARKSGQLASAAAEQSRRFAEIERALEQVRRREADALRKVAEVERRADKFEAAAGEEKAGRREAVARLERAQLAAAEASRELDDLRAGLEASARSAEEDREAALADSVRRLADAEAEMTDVRRREAAALRDLSGAQRRAERLEAALEKEKGESRELASRLQRAEQAAADAGREAGELRAAAEVRDRAAAKGGEAETAEAELRRRAALAENELADSRRREGDALRDLAALKLRTEQFEAAVGAEQDARRDAQERCERAEQAAARAAEQVLALKAQADRREAELQARLGEDAPAAVPASAGAAAAPQAPPGVFEPPSKVPSVMRGARGVGAGSGVAAPATVAAVQALEAPEAAATSKKNRRDQRVASRMPVSIWRQGMSQAVGCTLVDKSASGAKVELPAVKFGETNSAVGVGVGDKLTLTFSTAQERTTVSCQVMWFDGRSCGLKYCGPFHTEQIKARKPVPRGKSSLVR